MILKDLTGKKFGRLTVLRKVGADKNRHVLYLCKCDCGKEKIITGNSLKNNFTKSCGCLQKEAVSKSNTKHGKTDTKLFCIWNEMKYRCYKKTNRAYINYGGRGIKVCELWLNDFMNFYNWAIKSGYKQGLTIDRIDVNGNYTPENCRWATYKEQENNKRNNKKITYRGETKTFSEWCDELKLNYPKTLARINKLKWDIKRAFETP